NCFALTTAPSTVLLLFLQPVMVFIPSHTSLILFSCSFCSTFFLYESFASLSMVFSSPCTRFRSSWSPSLKALLFLLRRCFTLEVIQCLLLGKQRTVLVGATMSIQKFRWSVVQCVTPSMSSPKESCSTLQSVDSKQSLRASAASGEHFLHERAVDGCLHTFGVYLGCKKTRL